MAAAASNQSEVLSEREPNRGAAGRAGFGARVGVSCVALHGLGSGADGRREGREARHVSRSFSAAAR
jgi:hypothetical protein